MVFHYQSIICFGLGCFIVAFDEEVEWPRVWETLNKATGKLIQILRKRRSYRQKYFQLCWRWGTIAMLKMRAAGPRIFGDLFSCPFAPVFVVSSYGICQIHKKNYYCPRFSRICNTTNIFTLFRHFYCPFFIPHRNFLFSTFNCSDCKIIEADPTRPIPHVVESRHLIWDFLLRVTQDHFLPPTLEPLFWLENSLFALLPSTRDLWGARNAKSATSEI